jgi:hypothetical protein
MSISVETSTISSVLIGGEWHQVIDQSFSTGTFEYVSSSEQSYDASGATPADGFSFTAGNGERVAGPISAVQAVRCGG